MSKTVNSIDALRTWFRTCPALDQAKKFGTDYLSANPTEYSLYAVPSSLILKENICGDLIPADIQTVNYIFAIKAPYGADAVKNALNLGFMQEVTAWIIEQNNNKNFPDWGEGTILSIYPTLTAAPVQIGASEAKYQIQMNVKYRRK